MPFTPFETAMCGVLVPLALAEGWNALARYPRMISRVEILEVRRTEDRAQIDMNTVVIEAMKINIAESNVKFLNLLRQCEEERALNRLMQRDWTKNQKDLGEAVTELRTTLNMINQTLLHNSNRRSRREED